MISFPRFLLTPNLSLCVKLDVFGTSSWTDSRRSWPITGLSDPLSSPSRVRRVPPNTYSQSLACRSLLPFLYPLCRGVSA